VETYGVKVDEELRAQVVARYERLGIAPYSGFINARLAARAAEKEDIKEAKRHISMMKASGFEKSYMEEALNMVIMPVLERVRILCASAQKEAAEDPASSDQAAWRLLGSTEVFISLMNIMLPKKHALRKAAHNELSQAILAIQVLFGKETDNWAVSLELLKCAQELAVSDSARQRIDSNIKIVENNLLLSTCWFCGVNPAEDDHAVEVKMHGDVNHLFDKVTWRHTTVTIPRCGRCQSNHRPGNRIGRLFSADKRTRAKETKPLSTKKDFPRIKQLLDDGWNYGERPPNV